jgi:hypothetical protein
MKHLKKILFSAAVLAALPVVSANAQVRLADSRTIPASNKGGDSWEAKPLGIYDVTLDTQDRAVSARITISQTQDKLVALFWADGDEEGQAMDVTVGGSDLVLSAKTRKGPMEVSISRFGNKLFGTWALGAKHGSLKGEVTS